MIAHPACITDALQGKEALSHPAAVTTGPGHASSTGMTATFCHAVHQCSRRQVGARCCHLSGQPSFEPHQLASRGSLQRPLCRYYLHAFFAVILLFGMILHTLSCTGMSVPDSEELAAIYQGILTMGQYGSYYACCPTCLHIVAMNARLDGTEATISDCEKQLAMPNQTIAWCHACIGSLGTQRCSSRPGWKLRHALMQPLQATPCV